MRWCHRLLAILVTSAVVSFAAGDSPSPSAPEVPQFALPQALRSFANSHGIAITGFDGPPSSGGAAAGDTVSVLITLREPKRVAQWLGEFRVADRTPEEVKKTKSESVTMSMNRKRSYTFSGNRTLALDIRTIGPCLEGTTTPLSESRARTLISPDLLSLGVDSAARALLAMKGKPKDAELSPEIERGFVGFFPAMVAFFTAVEKTPGLQDILWDVIEKPSVWSMVKSLGRTNLNIVMDNAAEVPSPLTDFAESTVRKLDVRLELNKQPTLNCQFYVTAPRPPLLTTAGVLRITAVRPGRSDIQLEVRLLASRLAPDRKSASGGRPSDKPDRN